jgi:hypothetical protein
MSGAVAVGSFSMFQSAIWNSSPENSVHAQSDKTYDNIELLHPHLVATVEALFGNIKGLNSSHSVAKPALVTDIPL